MGGCLDPKPSESLSLSCMTAAVTGPALPRHRSRSSLVGLFAPLLSPNTRTPCLVSNSQSCACCLVSSPIPSHQRPLWQWRVVFMSRQGITALDGLAKTKESDKVLQGKSWCTLARYIGCWLESTVFWRVERGWGWGGWQVRALIQTYWTLVARLN